MKFFVVLAALVASSSANGFVGLANTGKSAVTRSEDGLGNYAFGYNEDHAFGGTFRKEKGAPGMKIGSYGLREADGRMRVVNYVADAHGFRASVSTNEPGTDVKQDPAAVNYNLDGVAVSAPVAMGVPAPDHTVFKPYAASAIAPVIHGYGVPAVREFIPPSVHAFAAPDIAAPIAHTSVVKSHIAAPAIANFVAPAIAPKFMTNWAAPAIANFATAHIAAPKIIANNWAPAPGVTHFTGPFESKIVAAPAIANFATAHVAAPKIIANNWAPAPGVTHFTGPLDSKVVATPAIANFAGDWAQPMAATKVL